MDGRAMWFEPVFLLALDATGLWGQPYSRVLAEPIFGAHTVSTEFVANGDMQVTSVVGRLGKREGSTPAIFNLINEAGTTIASAELTPAVAAHPWPNAYVASFASPVWLAAGEVYRLVLSAPGATTRRDGFTHWTPATDYAGSEMASKRLTASRQALVDFQDLVRDRLSKKMPSVDLGTISGLCGNSQLDSDEQCDGAASDACPGQCQADCTCSAPPESICGDNVRSETSELCDGSDDAICPGHCRDDCTCGVDYPELNLAPLASVRASSTTFRQRPKSATDQVVGGIPGDPSYEWASREQGPGAWLRLTWPSPIAADRVILHDRPSLVDNLLGATLAFDDGSTITLGAIPADGRGYEVKFPARSILSITLTIAAFAGTPGLSEIEVLAAPVPPTATLPPATPAPSQTRTSTPKPTPTGLISAGATPTPDRGADATATHVPSPSPSPSLAPSTGPVFYLSPTGDNNRSGLTPGDAKRTFSAYFNSAKPLSPGSTLVLLDGTYTATTTGLPAINCAAGGNANNGTAGSPITIRAANERRAHISVTGIVADALSITDCRYYSVEGIYGSNSDVDGAPSWQGYIFSLLRVDHVTLRRLLGVHPNKLYGGGLRNTHTIGVTESTNVLLEENEAYDYHRHAFSMFQSRFVVVRRNYANARGIPSGVRESIVLYGTSDSVVENCIVEGDGGQYSIIGIQVPLSIDPTGTGGQRNKILGSIAHNAGRGFKIGSRYIGGVYRNAKDNLLENVVASSNALGNGILMRASAKNTVRNATIYQNRNSGFVADDDGGAATSYSGTCAAENVDGCSATLHNVLSFGQSVDSGVYASFQDVVVIKGVNAVGNYVNFGGQAGACGGVTECSNKMSADPLGMGLAANQCVVWVPDASNMKGVGEGGGDVGATILYKYEDGVLTARPLWGQRDGRFAGCGAVVPGINDVAGNSCVNVQLRLNINQNGCRFPSGYMGW